MSSNRKRGYILFRSDSEGLEQAEVVQRVQEAPNVELLNEGGSALLVEGAASDVKALTLDLDGWVAEANGMTSSG